MDEYYKDEYVTETTEHISPTNKYKLIIKTYDTSIKSGKSTWAYTQGFVYDINNNLIGSIKRNYSSFPFVFFKQGPKEYLVSGRSYMRQTILDLETGKVYDNTEDPDADDFCWAEIIQLDENTIVAQGCYWGGGYEYRFFDFTNISILQKWPELKVEEICSKYVDVFSMSEHRVHDNILELYHMNYDYNDDDWDDDDNDYILTHNDIMVKMKRTGDIITMMELTLSERQKIKEHEDDIRRKERDIKITALRDNSPFYQQLIPKINALELRVSDRTSYNIDKFDISIYYKKIKCVLLRFANGSKVSFAFYDFANGKNSLSLEFGQDVNIIDDIICKIKELLVA